MFREPDRLIRRGYLVDWESSCEVDGSGQAVEAGRAVCDSLLQDVRPTDRNVLGYMVLYVYGHA